MCWKKTLIVSPITINMPGGKAALMPYELMPTLWLGNSWWPRSPKWVRNKKPPQRGSLWDQKPGLGLKIPGLSYYPGTGFLGTGPLAWSSTSLTFCCFMGMVGKRVRSHPLSSWNGARAEGRLICPMVTEDIQVRLFWVTRSWLGYLLVILDLFGLNQVCRSENSCTILSLFIRQTLVFCLFVFVFACYCTCGIWRCSG